MGLDNPVHIILVLVVVLMLFGAKRLPEMGRGLGSGMRSFKEGLTTDTSADVTVAAPMVAAEQTAPATEAA